MDRRRNKKNATSNKFIKKIRANKYIYISIFLGATLLSCTQQRQTPSQSNSRQYYDHVPKNTPILNMQQRFADMLNVHNRIRAKHNLPPLTWSKHLTDYSLEWANHLGRGNQCQMYHRGKSSPFGENLYISSAEVWKDESGREVDRKISPITITEVVNSWASEEKWYNYQQNRCQPGQQCGHYTQIVWKDTTEVGCAMKVCPDKSQTWVCSYNPAGNYVGERPY